MWARPATTATTSGPVGRAVSVRTRGVWRRGCRSGSRPTGVGRKFPHPGDRTIVDGADPDRDLVAARLQRMAVGVVRALGPAAVRGLYGRALDHFRGTEQCPRRVLVRLAQPDAGA